MIYFENFVKEDKNSLNDLFLDSINDLSKLETKELNYEFLIFLFIEIFNQYQKSQDDLFKSTIKKYFEDLNLQILEKKSIDIQESKDKNKQNLDINLKDLEVLSDKDTYKIRNLIISLTGNKEETNKKIDIFLCFYYIYFQPTLFISFVDAKKDKFGQIKSNIMSYKKLFNDFNSDVLNFDIMNEAENLEQIQELIINFVPNMVQLFKMLSNDMFYSKLVILTLIEQKNISILKVCKPQKTDDIEEMQEYFDIIIDLFSKERYLPIHFGKEFYIEYCKIFLNENLENIEIIHSMLRNYNIHISEKFRIKIDKEIDQYYHDTGIYLIKNKKLINEKMIDFLKNDPYFQKKENIITIDLIAEGIVFKEEKKYFIIKFLENKLDDIDFKKIFGHSYYDFMKKIFDKFKKAKDLMLIKDWEIPHYIDIEVLVNIFYSIKRLWLEDPKNHMYVLQKLIANTFAKASLKIDNYLNIINDLEKNISADLLLPIYTTILYRAYEIKDDFNTHIISFIRSNSGKSPISVWYILNTYEDNEEQKNKYLENNLKEDYAVKAENFIDYPFNTDERISLFAYLYNAKYFIKNENLTNMPYYIESIKSKDNIYNLKYLDAMKIQNNIHSFQDLFVFFIPGPYNENNAYIVYSFLIEFSENCIAAKNFYDSLNIIYSHWNKFYKNEKRNELDSLKNLISQYENSPLKECQNIQKNNESYLNYLPEVKEGQKLMKSIFFISIYDSNKDEFKNRDTDKYEATLKTFNELKKLAINPDINSLEEKLKNILIDSVKKDQDKLKDELVFIKSYFGFDGKDILNIKEIENNLLKLAKE